MTDQLADGRTRVAWVPAVNALAAPSTAEINAGTELTTALTADGLVGFTPDTGDVDSTEVLGRYRTTVPGRAAFSGTLLRLKKQAAAGDATYDLLAWGTFGYVVVRRDYAVATAWANGQRVEVYPAECGEVRNLPPEANSVHRYEVPLFLWDAPALRGSVGGPAPVIPDEVVTDSAAAAETVVVSGLVTVVQELVWVSDWDVSVIT